VVDDHVDRPGVEAQQCVKLTGTNSSIGLIVLIGYGHRLKKAGRRLYKDQFHHAFRRPGGSSEVAAPDPIPNSEVKRLSANGTLSQGTGE
jgi:hypothetical protein